MIQFQVIQLFLIQWSMVTPNHFYRSVSEYSNWENQSIRLKTNNTLIKKWLMLMQILPSLLNRMITKNTMIKSKGRPQMDRASWVTLSDWMVQVLYWKTNKSQLLVQKVALSWNQHLAILFTLVAVKTPLIPSRINIRIK
jgi:hypothetical protein